MRQTDAATEASVYGRTVEIGNLAEDPAVLANKLALFESIDDGNSATGFFRQDGDSYKLSIPSHEDLLNPEVRRNFDRFLEKFAVANPKISDAGLSNLNLSDAFKVLNDLVYTRDILNQSFKKEGVYDYAGLNDFYKLNVIGTPTGNTIFIDIDPRFLSQAEPQEILKAGRWTFALDMDGSIKEIEYEIRPRALSEYRSVYGYDWYFNGRDVPHNRTGGRWKAENKGFSFFISPLYSEKGERFGYKEIYVSLISTISKIRDQANLPKTQDKLLVILVSNLARLLTDQGQCFVTSPGCSMME